MLAMKAMILAAGYGERLWPLSCDRTKPAFPVLGKPLVGFVAEYLARFGFEDIVVNLHHQSDSVRAALGDGSKFGVRLRYAHEPLILGTGGALDNARELLQGETFVVVNGKLITDLDLKAALETHRQKKALATLVLLRNPKYERFSIVETRDGLVTGFGRMPAPGPSRPDEEPPLMFTGIHILESRIFEYIPRGVFSHTITDVYLPAIANGERIAAHVAEGMWYELSTLERYLDISLALLRRQGSQVYPGCNSSIDPNAEVNDAVLWDNVIVERGAHVRRAVLGDGVRIRSGERIEDAVVVRAELVSGKTPPAKALKGHVQGDNFVVSLSQ
jgi:NDP-sugar pyrophosphorylase family protein